VGDITVTVRYSGRYYCQSELEWAILLSEVEWAILLSECGTVGDITVRVR
jgi:hypothetical protein